MSLRRRFRQHRVAASTVGFACTVALAPVSLSLAQAPKHFVALSVPPAAVGTCVDDRHGNVRVNGRLAQSRLALRGPTATRDVFVARDSAGHLIAFSDRSTVMIKPLVKSDESISAKLFPDGRIAGIRERSLMTYADSGVFRGDEKALRRLAATTRVVSSSEELNLQGQRDVRALVKWLVKRCPG